MNIIKLFGGDLDDYVAFFRSDLSQAASPLQQWDEDAVCWVSTSLLTQPAIAAGWVSTINMAALAKSLAAAWVEMSVSEFYCEWEEVSGFVEDADTSHEDARSFYLSCGWHLTTDLAGDVCHRVVEYDWLDDDDDDIVAKIMADDADLSDDEAETIVAKAREIREVGYAVEDQLKAAVRAYKRNDYAACVKALRLAGEIDTPASNGLRSQLIDDSLVDIFGLEDSVPDVPAPEKADEIYGEASDVMAVSLAGKSPKQLRDAKMGSVIANAAGKLPEDWMLSINIQEGGWSISLFDPDGNDIETEQSDDMSDAINNAVAEANATSKEASSS